MQAVPKALQKLVAELAKLPSIGQKSAARLAYHLINGHRKQAEDLIAALSSALVNVRLCQRCYFTAENDLCAVCTDVGRDPNIICVVEKPTDLIAIEKAGVYRGFYHVLHGLWAPLKRQTLADLKLDSLIARVSSEKIKEVIIATGSTVEGEATAMYIARLLEGQGVRATRLAQGLPKGGELEYLDDVTLSRALSGRTQI